ncbi:MAG: S8 family serine peptidase [Anaerolineae bacterium]|nr:S8 family serine peptidase [Anaerolineae bacterium]
MSFNDAAGHTILEAESVWQLGLYGQGQVIAVADTGLDTGDFDTLCDDLKGRVRQAFALGRPDDWSDPQGHGTHVAGSAAGSGALSGSNPAVHQYSGSFAGVAPEADLVLQSLMDADGGLGGLPGDLGELLGQAYDAGARVHTNSWGANFFIKPLARFLTAGRYTVESAQVDRFVWEHPDLVVLFAAGNEGVDILTPYEGGLELPPPDGVVDQHSTASPGTAKNVITVGASEGLRSSGGHAADKWGGTGDLLSGLLGDSYTAEPLASDLPSDNANGMAPFSSRGPTNDGRIKPDVVAPGTNIISARSHDPGAGELFGAYDANYVYCSGTSMATPLVAGAVALIREWYVERQGVSNPSAALIKATLINGAVDISPGQFGRGPTQDVPDAWPNPVTGWGRVNLIESVAPGRGREVWFVDENTGLNTGQEAVYTRYVAAGDEPLRVTLVWTDPPGPVEPESIQLPGVIEPASPVLVNDLDLIVETPDGRAYRGNMGAEPDRLNNVEAVRVVDPLAAGNPAGDYRIVVHAYQVQQGPQPFALVVAGRQVVSGPGEPARPGGEARGSAQAGTESREGAGLVVPLLVGMGALSLALIAGIVLALRGRQPVQQAALPGVKAGFYPASQPAIAGGRHAPQVGSRGQGVTASLRVEGGPLAGQSFAIDRSPFTIGRGADNNLIIPESSVSRRHACLELQAGRWFVRDLGSSNGTFLNRQVVEDSPQPLNHGDLIGMGDSAFAFVVHPPQVVEAQGHGVQARAVAQGNRVASQRFQSKWVVAAAIAVVVILLTVAAVLLFDGLAGQEEQSGSTPGLPSIGLPTGLPSAFPTIQLPTGMPTIQAPTGFPTGLPVPTGEMPLPTGLPAMPSLEP